MKNIPLFCKTWKNDYPWLKQAIISVGKTCKVDVHWTIVCDDGEKGECQKVIDQAQQQLGKKFLVALIETSEFWPEASKIQSGYLRQQWIKMTAHRVMGKGLFLYWDSDVIGKRPWDSTDIIGNSGKPIYWMSTLSSMQSDNHDQNRAFNERAVLLREIFSLPYINFEWMRCMPIAMWGDVLFHGEQSAFWRSSFDAMARSDNRMSEFNVIGQFASMHFIDSFEWRNTLNFPFTFGGPLDDSRSFVTQSWSWGGCNDQIINFVKAL